jgi:hypothetical protein
MRPALKPGLLAVWRNRDTVQIGIDPRRAVALTGMRGAGPLLHLLDGSRDRLQVLAAAGELGMDAHAADRVLALLAAAGALDDLPAGDHGALPPGLRARLAPELATASLAHRDGDGGARTLARRRSACVRVHGASRAGLWTAALLSEAGIGMVISTVASPARPGGAVAGGAGRPGPRGRTSRARPRRPTLAVLADTHRRDVPAALVRNQVPHLACSATEAIGVVGPLVLPGRSACLRCLDLTRAEGDPAWPLILAQLGGRASPDPPACDAVLAAMVAAQVTAQALAFIDLGAHAGAVTNGTLELVLPDWQWRRRTWRPHPRCGCRPG